MIRRLALVAFLIAAPPLLAAVSRSALTGRVTSGGQPVAQATVTARSAALQRERTTITGPGGTYWLSALPPGEYEVTFAKTGMQSLTRRVTVALARIARADARLEPSEDEETVTSTVTTISVGHDTAIASHRTSEELDRLPVEVDIGAAAYLAPGVILVGAIANVDEAPALIQPDLVQSETVDEITLIRAAVPIEYATGGADIAIIARTRSGGENLSISLRDTITTGLHHFFETAAGGAIVPQRLWFFGAGWSGTRADAYVRDLSGLEIKLTGQLDDRQNVDASFIDHQRDFSGVTGYGASLAALRHTAQWNPHLVTELVASRTYASLDTPPFQAPGISANAFLARASHVFGDHVVSAGMEAGSGDFGDPYALFVHDRWWMQRAVIHAGVRYTNGDLPSGYNPGGPAVPKRDEDRIGAQLAAAYDLRGNGRHALTATATRHAMANFERIDEVTFGYIAALGATGSARADVIRRDYGGDFTVTSIIADASYRLFDRLEAGVNYTHNDLDLDPFFTFPIASKNSTNAWITMRKPIGSSAFAATAAYRYATSAFELFGFDSLHALDVALRYTFPIRRVAMTLAADAQNLFDSPGDPAEFPRTVRGWIRVRL